MKVLHREQIRELDHRAQDFGISGVLLMEHAAMALQKRVDCVKAAYGKRILIVCGNGNNGGDGFALARLLANDEEACVALLWEAKADQLSQEARYYYKIVQALEIPVYRFHEVNMKEYDIIVDCMFGTGLCREITGIYAEIIHKINDSNAYVIACDIASGLDADSGRMLGCAIQANETVSFAAGKLGLYMNEGLHCSGKVSIADISIPAVLMKEYDGFTILDENIVKSYLPKRVRQSHKGSYGKVLVIGGRSGMSGAALMCCEAALRCGAGTVTLMSEAATLHAAAVRLSEVMHHPLVNEEAALSQLLEQYDCIAIGNGLGRDETAQRLVKQVWKSNRLAIFDGDALYVLGTWKKRPKRKMPYVLTPHPKEVSYLLGTDTHEIVKNPSEALYRSEKAFPEAILTLKNACTMISDGKHRYLNVIGNDALATGGSGDVLCGMILGFMAQSKDLLSATLCAVYLHAGCADRLVKQMASHGVLPSDILREIPYEMHSLLNC